MGDQVFEEGGELALGDCCEYHSEEAVCVGGAEVVCLGEGDKALVCGGQASDCDYVDIVIAHQHSRAVRDGGRIPFIRPSLIVFGGVRTTLSGTALGTRDEDVGRSLRPQR